VILPEYSIFDVVPSQYCISVTKDSSVFNSLGTGFLRKIQKMDFFPEND
jgi:hypothetical protein